jgi:hypothetical protein
MRTRKPSPRLYVVSSDTGQVYDADVRPRQRGGSTITALYGPNWLAMPTGAAQALASDKELAAAELRMTLFLLSKMRPGNHVDMRPVDVANEMGLNRSNAARTLRKLRDKGIIIDRKPFGWRLDPNYVFRGDPTGLVGKRRDGSLVLIEN